MIYPGAVDTWPEGRGRGGGGGGGMGSGARKGPNACACFFGVLPNSLVSDTAVRRRHTGMGSKPSRELGASMS